MKALKEFKKHLKPGQVYRRSDLEQWSKAVDRHLKQLVDDETLQKLSQGLYYYPMKASFGNVPPEDEKLVSAFLKTDDFLLATPNLYNSLGVGTTQLYNKRTVYNHKRHGQFTLGGKVFNFHLKHKFPKELSEELQNLFLYNLIGWRPESNISTKPHMLAIEATHDTPSTFNARWQEFDQTERDQTKGFLYSQGYEATDGDASELVASKVIAAMEKCENLIYSLTIQTELGLIENSRINTPGTMGLHNWTWRLPSALEELLEAEKEQRRQTGLLRAVLFSEVAAGRGSDRGWGTGTLHTSGSGSTHEQSASDLSYVAKHNGRKQRQGR